MSGNFFSKFDSEYFSLIIFLKYLLILLLMLIFVTKMTLLEKNKICRTFRAVGHLGTLQTVDRQVLKPIDLLNKQYKITNRKCNRQCRRIYHHLLGSICIFPSASSYMVYF